MFHKESFRATAILLVYPRRQDHPKIPAIEQVLAVAVKQAMLGLNAMGYGTIRRGGLVCFTQKTTNLLGPATNDQIFGLIYVSTPVLTLSIVQHTGMSERVDWYNL